MELINLEDETFFDWTIMLSRKRTKLKVDIWSKWCGSNENKQPYIIIGNINRNNCYLITATISPALQILSKTKNISQEEMQNIESAFNYIERNYGLFLNHFNGIFDDDDLISALKQRKDYI